MIRRSISAQLLAGLLVAGVAHAQEAPPPGMLIQWVPPSPPEKPSLIDGLKRTIDRMSDFLVRSTSPDMPNERWLWVIARDGTRNRAIVRADGARHPRWGASGWIVFESEHDTNGDGLIDARDELHVSIVRATGGEVMDVGAGQSPVWSPDGSRLAFLRNGRVVFYDVAAKKETSTVGPGGSLIYSDRRSIAASAKKFWLLDTQSGTTSALPDASSKYLWMGAVTPSGDAVVYHDNQRAAIIVRTVSPTASKQVFRDSSANIDPSWSPDATSIVYVSTRKP